MSWNNCLMKIDWKKRGWIMKFKEQKPDWKEQLSYLKDLQMNK